MEKGKSYWWIVAIAGVLVVLLSCGCCGVVGIFFGAPYISGSLEKGSMERAIKKGIEEKDGVTISKIHLIKKGNEYVGMATTTTGQTYEISEAISGGGVVQYKTRKQ